MVASDAEITTEARCWPFSTSGQRPSSTLGIIGGRKLYAQGGAVTVEYTYSYGNAKSQAKNRYQNTTLDASQVFFAPMEDGKRTHFGRCAKVFLPADGGIFGTFSYTGLLSSSKIAVEGALP